MEDSYEPLVLEYTPALTMSVNPTIRELIEQRRRRGDEVPPTSKAGLARFMAGLFEHQGDELPNFDEFIHALARPRWKWTPKADKIFRRINRIRSPIRSPARTVRDIILQLDEARGRNKRPAVRRQNNRSIPAPAPAPAPVPAPANAHAPVLDPAPAESESSVSECTVESIDISSTAPTACTPSNGHL